MNAISDLLNEIKSYGLYTPEYYAKQIHHIPEMPVYDRLTFLLAYAKDRRVLNIGANSGPLHAALAEVAQSIIGVDKDLGPYTDIEIDLDEDVAMLPRIDIDVVICGEVLEHLSNPGNFLKALKKYACPIVITVPNAFSRGSYVSVWHNSIENVNIDHVAWYSYRTLKTLVERYDYSIREMAWYGGPPRVSEGLIFVIQ